MLFPNIVKFILTFIKEILTDYNHDKGNKNVNNYRIKIPDFRHKHLELTAHISVCSCTECSQERMISLAVSRPHIQIYGFLAPILSVKRSFIGTSTDERDDVEIPIYLQTILNTAQTFLHDIRNLENL